MYSKDICQVDKLPAVVFLQGVPGDGKFTNTTQLVKTISAMICTCSVGHAAANFNQYDEYVTDRINSN